MAEQTAEQVRAALKNQFIYYDPGYYVSGESPYGTEPEYRQIIGGALGTKQITPEEAARAAGISVDLLKRLEPGLDLGTNERTAFLSQHVTPGRGTGFFASLLGGVGGVVGGLTDTVVDPVANALGVHPDAIKAAAALAGMYYGGEGLFFDAATGAAVPEATAVELIAPELAANTGAPAVAAAAPAVATASPVIASPLAAPSALAGDTLGASLLGLTPEQIAAATSANALAPTAAATAAGANALSPETLAALDAGLGGVPAGVGAAGAGAAGAGTVAPALNFEQIAAESLGANVPGAATGVSGSSVFTPATAATTAVTNALAPALNHEQIAAESLGANLPGAATGVAGAATVAGLSTGAFDALAKFAKDYGVPLASLISGITGSQAAQSAAETQARSAAEARQLARDIFNEQKALQEPFRTAGITAQNQLLTLLGLPGGTQGAEYGKYARPFGMQDFQADPGYAFRLSEGMKALEASRAAKGGLLSGATGKALSRYGQDLASQEYGNAFNRFQTERVNRLQPLGALMGTGQAAAAGQAGYAGQYGQTAGGLTTDIGATQAAGGLGSAKAISNALGTYMNYLGNQNLAQAIRESQYNR
jgi:hypothetical protein